MTTIVAVWQSLLKQEKGQDGQKGSGEDASVSEEITAGKETNGEHGRKTLVILSNVRVNSGAQ